MIPEDIQELEEERKTQRGSSSLPVTNALEDDDNLDIACNFLYVLYKGARSGNKNQKMDGVDSETCSFWKISRLRKAAVHYDGRCQGTNCTELHCRQAVDLHIHWKNCDKSCCFICTSAVDLLMEKFCQYLGEKGEEYDRLVLQIKMADLAAKKQLVKRLVVGHDS